jgi:hypothetical protein
VRQGRAIRGWHPATRFLAYGLAGSVAEALFTSAVASVGAGGIVRRGPSTPLMVALYGLALPLFEPVHDRVRGRPAWQRGAVYAGGIMAVETVSGLAWRAWTGRVPWEYRSGLAVAGVTRLDYAPAWAIVGLAAERLHDTLTEHVPRSGARSFHAVAGQATLRGLLAVLPYAADNARDGRGLKTQRHRSLLSRSVARHGVATLA